MTKLVKQKSELSFLLYITVKPNSKSQQIIDDGDQRISLIMSKLSYKNT